MTESTRDGRGRFDRSPETAKRDAEAARLRAQSLSYREIAAELGVDVRTAHAAVQRALTETVAEAADDVRRLELERLDDLARQARKVMLGTHYVIAQGKVVRLRRGGAPLEDDGPILQAIDRLLKIQERRARLLGLDAPVKVSAEAQGLGAEIAGLLAELTGRPDEPSGGGPDPS